MNLRLLFRFTFETAHDLNLLILIRESTSFLIRYFCPIIWSLLRMDENFLIWSKLLKNAQLLFFIAYERYFERNFKLARGKICKVRNVLLDKWAREIILNWYCCVCIYTWVLSKFGRWQDSKGFHEWTKLSRNKEIYGFLRATHFNIKISNLVQTPKRAR